MKKLIVILLIILSCSFAYGQEQIARMVIGSGTSGATVNYTADANCMGAWFMNGAATEVDRTANGNDLTESGAIPTSATVPSGYSGTSRDFEAGNLRYLTIGDGTELDINGADAKLSIVAWVRLESVPADTVVMGVVSKYITAGNQRQYQLVLIGTGSSQFRLSLNLSQDSTTGAGTYTHVESTTTTYVGSTWYHIAAVYDDVDMRLYVNGALDCTPVAKTNGIFNGTSVFTIGSLSSLSNFFDGLTDEVAVFNRDLSAAEVLDIYTNGISGNKGLGD